MTKKKDPTAAEREARYASRQKDKGLVRVSVWVPRGSAQKVRALARELFATSLTVTRKGANSRSVLKSRLRADCSVEES